MLKRYGRLMIATSLVSLLPTIAGLILWNRLPEQVPIHFDFEGNPDNYGSRAFAVFFIPLFLLAMQWLCLLITRTDPKRRNVSPKVMTLVLWICPLISVLVGVIMYASALGAQLALGRIMPVLFGLLFVAIGNYLPKCKQNYTVGIKLPWTLCVDHRRHRARHHRAGRHEQLGIPHDPVAGHGSFRRRILVCALPQKMRMIRPGPAMVVGSISNHPLHIKLPLRHTAHRRGSFSMPFELTGSTSRRIQKSSDPSARGCCWRHKRRCARCGPSCPAHGRRASRCPPLPSTSHSG